MLGFLTVDLDYASSLLAFDFETEETDDDELLEDEELLSFSSTIFWLLI